VTKIAELEREVTRLVVAGLSIAEIATCMRLSKESVRKLLENVNRKITATCNEVAERSGT